MHKIKPNYGLTTITVFVFSKAVVVCCQDDFVHVTLISSKSLPPCPRPLPWSLLPPRNTDRLQMRPTNHTSWALDIRLVSKNGSSTSQRIHLIASIYLGAVGRLRRQVRRPWWLKQCTVIFILMNKHFTWHKIVILINTYCWAKRTVTFSPAHSLSFVPLYACTLVPEFIVDDALRIKMSTPFPLYFHLLFVFKNQIAFQLS